MRLPLLSFVFLFTSLGLNAQVQVRNLRCETLQNPVGIDVVAPRLSWEISSAQRSVRQTAYEVIVASTKEKLAANEGDLWNSGKVITDRSIQVSYDVHAGKALTSRQQCYWKVKVFTNKGELPWSSPAFFSMGLLHAEDWQAKWIGYDKASPWDSITTFSRLSARYLRKSFEARATVERATAYIVGLGLYELYINGARIGNNVLAPAPTDYRKSVLYNTYDVTTQVKTGANVVATVLGNGRFFTMRQNYKPQKINTFGYPKLLLQLEIEYTNGTKQTIASDESWKLNVDGPTRTANEYDGEEYDATKALQGWNTTHYTDAQWLQPELVAAPAGIPVAQMNEPMKVMRTITPVSIKKQASGKYIIDMGQNFSGWLQLKAQGLRGQKITLRFAESLEPDGGLYVANLRDARATDAYTLAGTGVETWHPSFVYHGFRYVEVSNYPGTPVLADFQGQMVYDDLATIGSFQCSNATINQVYKNAWWGIASDYKGMPVDCPQRNERQPWLGDRATGAYGESFLFANQNLYAKWLDDIEQSQTAEGAIPDVAPAFWNYYSDNVTWPGTYILVANMLYHQFGDVSSITKHYASMRKWMEYMQEKYMTNYIVTKDKYGDWCVPPESPGLIHAKDTSLNTSGPLIATAYYYQLLQYMQQFAVIAGRQEDVTAYANLAANIKTAFQQQFYNKAKKYYDNNTITANLLPLYFGITPESDRAGVFNNIYNKVKIDNHMHISTGVIGTQWLMRVLTNYEHPDIAYTLASNTSYPSWGYMAANGATTIWELWNGNTASHQMNSQNHVMLLGDLLIWLYEDLAGIRSADSAVAFKQIIMKPAEIDGLDSVKASYHSLYGEIRSNWHRSIGGFWWNISIPANTTARIYIPAAEEKAIMEGNKSLTANEGVRFIGMEGTNAVIEIGSGNYTFHSVFPFRKGIVKDEFIFTRAGFPESHASTIAETPKGLIAAWFGGTKEGNKDVCIWTSRLVNHQWAEPVKVADGIINDTTRYACYNPVLYQVPGGELLLFYKIGPNVAGWTGWMMRSADNGLTWSKREALPEGYLGPIKNKPVLVNGVLVCPSSTEKTGWKVHFEYTPDNGRTWRKSDDINDGKTSTAIQPSLLVYKDGRQEVLCRSKSMTVNESWSSDGGKTWSAVTASSLPNNNSGTDAVTLQDGTQMIVYNHVKPPANAPNGKGARTPLNIAVSKDGKTWYAALVLENSPVSQYSYPSIIQTKDGKVHVVYTWRRERIKHIEIDPSQLEWKEISNGKWPGPSVVVTESGNQD
ncbi:alpha-L-rhamnosidase [Russula earlei]|uniref:Alpha-L-rhamnosidase n=1 Tax=Russula earlei TaxID=71964 RepID=A0ACC0TY85_9AGAM|nr:alpha-L-rhamnosidase [Russula earlei]